MRLQSSSSWPSWLTTSSSYRLRRSHRQHRKCPEAAFEHPALHPDIIIIQTSASSWHHHHPDISVIQASSSSRHQRHPDIIIILTSSSSRHQRHRHFDFIEPSADATVILKWHLENFSTNPLLTWLLTPTDNIKIKTSDLNMADLWRLQGWCFWLLSWFWFWIIRNQCIALYSFKAKWDK